MDFPTQGVISLLSLLSSTAASGSKSAALIIGGYLSSPRTGRDSEPDVLDSVELFGCGDSSSGSSNSSNNIHLPPFPGGGVYLTAGAHIPPAVSGGEGKVLVCGGYGCSLIEETSANSTKRRRRRCGPRRECFSWSPSKPGVWSPEPPMNEPRWVHLLATVALPGDRTVPMVLGGGGGGAAAEVMAGKGVGWRRYRELNGTSWYSLGCLAQHGGKVYSLREEVEELDPVSWRVTYLAEVPKTLAYGGRCAVAKMPDGRTGILLRFGYWLDLETLAWHTRAVPPFHPLAEIPNAMWSFEGRPTIFGNPKCGDDGTCINSEVVQYFAEEDAWKSIGSMEQPRTYHEVVEVPKSFCDVFGEENRGTTKLKPEKMSSTVATESLGRRLSAVHSIICLSLLSHFHATFRLAHIDLK